MSRRSDLGVDGKKIFIGEDVTIRCQLVKFDKATNADVVEGDVSANAYRFEVKQFPGDSTALIDVATGDTITFDDGDTTLGEITGTNTVLAIALSDTETEKITAEGEYHYDIWRTDDGNEAVVAYGKIFFSDSVRL